MVVDDVNGGVYNRCCFVDFVKGVGCEETSSS